MTEKRLIYSPEENHLAVIYTQSLFGETRFSRFVTEKEYCFFPPFTRRYILKTFYLGPRTAHIFLSNIFTADQVHLDVELKVFYRVDPRNAPPESFIQVLKMPSAGFESIVRTNTEEKSRNVVFVQKNAHEIFTYRGRKDLRKHLSSQIAERVKGFGITINPLYGISIINMQPNAFYQQAMQEASAAETQGKAAVKRLNASFEKIPNLSAEDLVNIQIASAITKTGNIPRSVHTHKTHQDGLSNNETRITQKEPPDEPKTKKHRGYKYPIAAD